MIVNNFKSIRKYYVDDIKYRIDQYIARVEAEGESPLIELLHNHRQIYWIEFSYDGCGKDNHSEYIMFIEIYNYQHVIQDGKSKVFRKDEPTWFTVFGPESGRVSKLIPERI